MVAVYDRPVRRGKPPAAGDEPAPVASLAPFARLRAEDNDWWVGVSGAHAGWLALRRDARWTGAPWSTCALWRLGRELQKPLAVAQAGASQAASSPPAAAPPESANTVCE